MCMVNCTDCTLYSIHLMNCVHLHYLVQCSDTNCCTTALLHCCSDTNRCTASLLHCFSGAVVALLHCFTAALLQWHKLMHCCRGCTAAVSCAAAELGHNRWCRFVNVCSVLYARDDFPVCNFSPPSSQSLNCPVMQEELKSQFPASKTVIPV